MVKNSVRAMTLEAKPVGFVNRYVTIIVNFYGALNDRGPFFIDVSTKVAFEQSEPFPSLET